MALPGVTVTQENFKEVMYSTCAQFLENFGGPYQCLKFWLGEEANQEWIKFADELQTHFPKRSDYRYLEGCHLPRDTSPHSTFQVPLWSLGWSKHCSTKPPPYKVTALQLVDEYLTNTFETGHEALNLLQCPGQGLCFHPISNEPLFFTLRERSSSCHQHFDAGARGHCSFESGNCKHPPDPLPFNVRCDLSTWYGRNRSIYYCFGKCETVSSWQHSEKARPNHLGGKVDDFEE